MSRTCAPRRAGLIGLALVAVLAAACSSSKQLEGATGTTTLDTTTVDTTPTTDSAPPDATDATIPDTAPDTTADTTPDTTVAPAAPLVLREDGIGSHHFGDEAGDVYDDLVAQLGEPASDTTVDYPVADGLGSYTTAEGDIGYIAPVGRTVCWGIDFCAEFGGASVTSSKSFTGWSYRNDTTGALHTTSGVTVGTRWSDVPSMNVQAGGCYSPGSGDVDGVRLILESSGIPFSEFDSAGNFISNLPPAEDVTVTWMEAGQLPAGLYGDC